MGLSHQLSIFSKATESTLEKVTTFSIVFRLRYSWSTLISKVKFFLHFIFNNWRPLHEKDYYSYNNRNNFCTYGRHLIGAGSVGQKPISLIVNGMTSEQFPLRQLPAPQIVDGYVMIPAASLKRTFREDVKWNSASRSIEINPDVWKEGGFGFKAEDWTKVRNVIYKYLIAVEEQDINLSDYISDGFQSNFNLGWSFNHGYPIS